MLFDLNMHTVNDEDDTAYAQAYVTVHTTRHVEKEAVSLDWSFAKITLPPHASSTIYDTLDVVNPMTFIMLVSHFHRHGTQFNVYKLDASGHAEMIYQNKEWDHPIIQDYDPPLRLLPGDKLTLAATYFNDTDQPIYYGPSEADEMCTLLGLYIKE
jgi:hypothetical protein